MFVQACTQHVPLTCKEWPYLSKLTQAILSDQSCLLWQVCQSGEGEEAGGMVKAGRQLESLALQAMAAVDPREAEGVWMIAFEKLTALGSSSKRLTQALVHRLTGLQKGPLRVSSPLSCCMLLHILGQEADVNIIMHESARPCLCGISAVLASWPH